MRLLLLLVLPLLACGNPDPAGTPTSKADPASAQAAAPAGHPGHAGPAAGHEGHAHTPAAAPVYAPAGPEWAKVPLAAGAVGTAIASTEVPPSFRNGAGKIACPVMGLAIASPEDAVSYADHDGVRYFFCCDSCEKLFLDDPVAYADGKYLAAHGLDPTAAPPACHDEAKVAG